MGDFTLSYLKYTRLLPFWLETSAPWKSPFSSAEVIGVSWSYIGQLVNNHQATISEAQRFDGEGGLRTIMRGGMGNDFIFGSSLPDLIVSGGGKDFLFNPPGSAASTIFSCQELDCNVMRGDGGDNFLHGAGRLSGLGSLSFNVFLPFFSTPPVPVGTTLYFSKANDMCFGLAGYPMSRFAGAVTCQHKFSDNLTSALIQYDNWYKTLMGLP